MACHYTDQVPSCGAVFPQGLQEIERSTYITGAVCVTNQSNFGLYFTFAKSAGDDEGAKINADWVNGFQHWVQEQSAHGLAPNFGDAEEPVIARAQNGVLYEAEAEGTATYMVVRACATQKPMNRRILHENRTQIHGALSECNLCRR
ncbi:MAG: hypothetical protein V8S13_00735 [Gemmiger formicilis]